MCPQNNFWFSGPRSEGPEQAEKSSKACYHGSLSTSKHTSHLEGNSKEFQKSFKPDVNVKESGCVSRGVITDFFFRKFPSHIIFSCLFWSLTNHKFSHLYGILGFHLPAGGRHMLTEAPGAEAQPATRGLPAEGSEMLHRRAPKCQFL